MEELVSYMVRSIVKHPNDVQVSTVEGAVSLLLELRVHPDDVEQVRGPDNRHFAAMQMLLAVAGGDRKPVLDLVGIDDADSEE